MFDLYRSNRPSFVVATAAIATASITVVAYSWFWCCKSESDGCDPGNRSSGASSPQQKYGVTQIKPPLRNVTPRPGEHSRIVYLTGIDKQTSEDELVELLSSGGGSPPVEIDASEVSFRKGGGRAWALYSNANDARRAIEVLQGKIVHGCTLCARLEWGVEQDGKRITDKTSHTAILRGIQRRRGTPKKKQGADYKNLNKKNKSDRKRKAKLKKQPQAAEREDKTHADLLSSEYLATYSHNSISIGEMEYPFPSGIYATKLIQKLSATVADTSSAEDELQQQQRKEDKKLLCLLSNVSIIGCGSVHRYAKEISETFAMIDALERAIKLKFGVGPGDLHHQVVCYCLGDGKYPVGAAALELFLPKRNHWKFVSIDPLLPKNGCELPGSKSTVCAKRNSNATTFFHSRIELFSGFSQDYEIQMTNKTPSESVLSIAIACHSHAPLEEFWERMPKPKLCVALPCCAQFSELPKETPILEYDNFEVYSPKRRIKIFASTCE
mmetsp:Transcript_8546/g.20903  ORF Transcript_8546/g.20903 Transcript_8546/m.20903 type:complete len:497 (+) Transcript_8546:107-1597(+)